MFKPELSSHEIDLSKFRMLEVNSPIQCSLQLELQGLKQGAQAKQQWSRVSTAVYLDQALVVPSRDLFHAEALACALKSQFDIDVKVTDVDDAREDFANIATELGGAFFNIDWHSRVIAIEKKSVGLGPLPEEIFGVNTKAAVFKLIQSRAKECYDALSDSERALLVADRVEQPSRFSRLLSYFLPLTPRKDKSK